MQNLTRDHSELEIRLSGVQTELSQANDALSQSNFRISELSAQFDAEVTSERAMRQEVDQLRTQLFQAKQRELVNEQDRRILQVGSFT